MRWQMKWNKWAVCASVFVITITRTGPVFSFGFFVAEFYKMYQVNMATLTWISVMAAGMCGILSPIPVYVLKYFNKHGYIGCCTFGIVTQSVCLFLSALVKDVRWMFLTFGLMYGVAYCFAHMSSCLYLSEIFPTGQKYHIIATATIWGGYATGQILYNLLVAWLLQIMSWANVFIILGAINLFLGLLCVSSFLLKNDISESSFSYSTLNEQVLENNNNEQINQIDKTENNPNSRETIQSNKRNDILQWLKIIFWLVGTMFSNVIMMALPGSFVR
ncbi:hypothetical protein HELRODRAFT_174031 [Helobdella robusta]|uniref:Major facilitator superfamily (MFS) profile domain-containing protein n=1 Tax=Helobdella robusta TaxID=6412 RepID=T1F7I2_HELRO|nr:hypothetical protein HELRODRAFT_174031 [Helobdella robusta]ESO03138.1 hypothetical protein HELRODRAFT_174031 [Helobdella robusta]